ncbi:GNAT family N-acetyltransferase [Pseudoalteromonas sp. SMS1]|uniref:GNAT family N-acetyltransferase n=1 Tax=Pseudoalteromonas sp. SMS1 TaxID=2908894 RepID=UPI001F195F78|nr:GNAT family N-acetyltransferase [Pseudoalteromonas sp. SMS1]MCF2858308.1 GNAT family N-acetyltransferase [Pseudoalteromonas sp. SMS1]
MQFETARLIIRPLQYDDLNDVYESRKNPETSKYIGPPASRKEAEKRIEEALLPWRETDHHRLMLAIICKTTRQFIGELVFKYVHKNCNIGEIGYRLSSQHIGKGYAFEATHEFIRCLFDRFSLNKINAICATDNQASWQLMEKLGMKKEGLLRENMYLHGQYQDSFIYSILKREMQ